MTVPLAVRPAVTGSMFLLMEDAKFGVLIYYLGLIGLSLTCFLFIKLAKVKF